MSQKQTVKKEATDTPSTSTPPSSSPLHIKKPNNDYVIWPPPKGVLQKSSYSLNVQVAQHYKVIKDLAQAPSAMSALEVLQTCLKQWKALLFAIGGIDPIDSNLITFDLENHVPHLPHQILFLIQVIIKGKMIHQTVIDEGASMCTMLVSCQKSIGSLPLNQSPNTLQAFDGIRSPPYAILTSFLITLEGKTIESEVMDVNLNYNIFLGESWTHAMFCVFSSLFHIICFPHEGKIVTVDQLAFFYFGYFNGNLLYVGNKNIPSHLLMRLLST